MYEAKLKQHLNPNLWKSWAILRLSWNKKRCLWKSVYFLVVVLVLFENAENGKILKLNVDIIVVIIVNTIIIIIIIIIMTFIHIMNLVFQVIFRLKKIDYDIHRH